MNRKKKSRKRGIWIAIAIVVVIAVAVVVIQKRNAGKANDVGPTTKVERGNVVEKALAVGSIVPRNEAVA